MGCANHPAHGQWEDHDGFVGFQVDYSAPPHLSESDSEVLVMNAKCPQGRLFREVGKTQDECRDLCNADQDCNFYSWGTAASTHPQVCMGCSESHWDAHDGFTSYSVVDDEVATLNAKCHQGRLFREVGKTQDECRDLCNADQDCNFYSKAETAKCQDFESCGLEIEIEIDDLRKAQSDFDAGLRSTATLTIDWEDYRTNTISEKVFEFCTVNSLGFTHAEYDIFLINVRAQVDAALKRGENECNWVPTADVDALLPSRCTLMRMCKARAMTKGDMASLVAALPGWKGRLDMSHCKLNDADVAILATALSQKSSFVNALDLSDNSIGEIGAHHLALVLPLNTELSYLSLNQNQLLDGGASALSDGLKLNSTLRNLELSRNGIGDAGTGALAGMLETANLMAFNLSFNRIGPSGARLLGKVLRNSKLKSLDLAGNTIGDLGAFAFAQDITGNSHLEQLVMWENGVSAKGAIAIVRALQRNNGELPLELCTDCIPCQHCSVASGRMASQVATKSWSSYVSLGENCWPALGLRELGMRTAAFPFDWSTTTTPPMVLDVVQNGYLAATTFDSCTKHPVEFTEPCFLTCSTYEPDVRHTNCYGQIFPHYSEITSEAVTYKLRRYYRRLFRLLNSKTAVLFVRFAAGSIELTKRRRVVFELNRERYYESLTRFGLLLKSKYPKLDFHVLNIEHGNENRDNDAITNANFTSGRPAPDNCDHVLDEDQPGHKDKRQLVSLLRAALRNISVTF
jgi:uncharacterized protein (DUF983 family)